MHRAATRHAAVRLAAGAASLTLAAGLLAACGNKDEAAPEPAAPELTSGAQAPESSADEGSAAATSTSRTSASATRSRVVYSPSHASSASASATSSEPTETESASASGAASTSGKKGSGREDREDLALNDSVTDAYAVFGDLAPRSLFAQFSECSPAGMDDSFNCSGPGIGQVQLIKSEAKAAQTTQVLTELRSSRVLSDDGNVVIGWSTLGSTAVLTAVDNDKGLVLQQMISTDQENPEAKLQDMGLLPS